MKQYEKNGIILFANEIIINKDGFNIINPNEKEILSDGWVEKKEEKPTSKELLEKAKIEKIYEINEYDKSSNVNHFFLKEYLCGFQKAIGLV